MEDILLKIQNGIIGGKTQYVMEQTELALKYGIRTDSIIEEAIQPPFKEMGSRMRKGDILITDVLVASRAAQAAMYILNPIISNHKGNIEGTIVIGTVAGDLHDIGKNLVIMMLRGNGYNVIDLGVDVTKEAFVEAIDKYKPDILGISALLTTTVPEIKKTLEYMKEIGIRDNVKVMIGGAPVTLDYAKQVMADAYTQDMFQAVQAANDLMNNQIGRYTIK